MEREDILRVFSALSEQVLNLAENQVSFSKLVLLKLKTLEALQDFYRKLDKATDKDAAIAAQAKIDRIRNEYAVSGTEAALQDISASTESLHEEIEAFLRDLKKDLGDE